MTIKTLKVGRFKPTCTGCKNVFILAIESLDPPKIKVGKSSKPIATPEPSEPDTDTKAKQEEQDASGRQSTNVPEVEAAPPTSPRGSFEQTIEQVSNAREAETQPERSPRHPTKPFAAADAIRVERLGVEDTLGTMASDLDSNAMHATFEHASSPPTNDVGNPDATFDFSIDRPDVSSPSKVSTPASPTLDGIEPTAQSKKSVANEDDFSFDAQPATHGGGEATKIEARASGSQRIPDRLGGYRILKELGRGGMGAVYLARQLSLDRQVALKTIQAEWASNPRVIARFIREAYAAAQLSHHNVVQIYDLGEEKGINFFSMELVRGGSLDELLASKGKLDARTAALYILQAARGLKFAHDHGMVHRDIKPANLMLTQDELVKVADLGLVKTPAVDESADVDEDRNLMLASAQSRVTGVGSTMGTPAYMSPEQADDAANVDQRADIYSLGCTFYALLTGSPPFTSHSAIEVITKHRTMRVERPDRVIEGIPAELGTIVERMTAKAPADRYQSLGETIRDLEKFLASDGTQPMKPQQDQVARLAQASRDFHAAPASKLRQWVPLTFIGGGGLLLILSLLISLASINIGLRLMTSVVALMLVTPIAVGIISAIQQGTSPIGSRIRTLVFGSTWSDWLTFAMAGLLLLAISYFLGLWLWWGIALLLSVGLGFAYQSVVQLPLRAQRMKPLTTIDHILRDLRSTGLSESSIQRFVVDNADKGWEEIFECIYDYDSLRQARSELALSGSSKVKATYLPWRDKLIDWMESKVQQVKARRDQQVLEKVEQANLKAKGVSSAKAKEQAAEMAASLVQVAAETRQKSPSLFGAGTEESSAKRERVKQMLLAARTGKPKTLGNYARQTTSTLLAHLLGGKLRFLIGSLMVCGCLAWANQNGLLNSNELKQVAKIDASQLDPSQLDASKLGDQAALVTSALNKRLGETKPLMIPLIGNWFTTFAPGLLGMLILMSSLFYGWRFSIFAIPAAVIGLLGPQFGIPSLGLANGSAWLSNGIGVGLLLLGLLLGRQKH